MKEVKLSMITFLTQQEINQRFVAHQQLEHAAFFMKLCCYKVQQLHLVFACRNSTPFERQEVTTRLQEVNAELVVLV